MSDFLKAAQEKKIKEEKRLSQMKEKRGMKMKSAVCAVMLGVMAVLSQEGAAEGATQVKDVYGSLMEDVLPHLSDAERETISLLLRKGAKRKYLAEAKNSGLRE